MGTLLLLLKLQQSHCQRLRCYINWEINEAIIGLGKPGDALLHESEP